MNEFRIRVVPRPWNKGKLVGQKAPLKLKEIWAIRVRLQVFSRKRELALFDLGIDSKLRACDLLKLKVRDLCHGERVGLALGKWRALLKERGAFHGQAAATVREGICGRSRSVG